MQLFVLLGCHLIPTVVRAWLVYLEYLFAVFEVESQVMQGVSKIRPFLYGHHFFMCTFVCLSVCLYVPIIVHAFC